MAYRSAHRLDFREKMSAYRRLLEVQKNLHIGSGSRKRLRVLARGPLKGFYVFALIFGKMKRRDDLLEVAKISHIGVLRAGKRTNCARARSVEQMFKYFHSCRTSVRFFGNKKRAFAPLLYLYLVRLPIVIDFIFCPSVTGFTIFFFDCISVIF